MSQNKLKNLPLVLVTVGIALRLLYYLQNCSLWLDEAWVALQLSTQSFKDILTLVPFAADLPLLPVGYLLINKIFIMALGNHEYALRLLSFIAGMFSVILFLSLLKRYARPKAVAVTMALFVFCAPLVYYSAEIKQYSSDILITIFLLWWTHGFRSDAPEYKKIRLFGYIGAVAVWFSYVSVFVLAGITATFLVLSVVRKQSQEARVHFKSGIFWGISFLGVFLLSRGPQAQTMKKMWAHAFVPEPIFSWESLIWLKESFLSMFTHTTGLSAGLLAAGIFVIGGIALFRRDKEKFFLLIAPIIIVLLAASLRAYPFYGRLLLFLIPTIVIFIGEGLYALVDLKPKFLSALPWVLGAVLLVAPVQATAKYAFYPCQKEQMRQTMQFFKTYYRRGDAVFMNNSAQFGFGYYHGYYNFMDLIANIGKIEGEFSKDPIQSAAILFLRVGYNRKGYLTGYHREQMVPLDLSQGTGPLGNHARTWFIFSHENTQQKTWILENLDRRGTQVKAYQGVWSSAHLYDLNI